MKYTHYSAIHPTWRLKGVHENICESVRSVFFSPQDTTKPFPPRFTGTHSSKYHRNTQYIKSESTYNRDEESDKHTTSVISRPAGQLLFSSLHPFLNPPEALQSGTHPQCYTNHKEQEANANLCNHFPSLSAAPHPHP